MSANPRGTDKSTKTARGRRTWLEPYLPLWLKAKPWAAMAAVLTVATLMIHFLIRPPEAEDLKHFQAGQLAPRLVSSPFDFEYIDEINTEAQRKQAEALVSPVYQANPQALNKMTQTIQAVAQAAQSVTVEADEEPGDWLRAVAARAGVELENEPYEIEPNPLSTAEALMTLRDEKGFWSTLLQSVYDAAGTGVVDNIQPIRKLRGELEGEEKPKVAVGATLIGEDGGERVAFTLAEIRTEEGFFQYFEALFKTNYGGGPSPDAASRLAMDLAQTAYAGPTLLYNAELTNARRAAASDRVAPVRVHVGKDETLIGKDQVIDAASMQALRALYQQMRISPIAELGYFFLALLFTLVLLKYLHAYYKDIAANAQRVAIIFAGVILILALTRVAEYLSLLDLGRNTLRYVCYAIPTGALGVILTILASPRMAVFVCCLTSLYVGLILEGAQTFPIHLALVSLTTSCGAIYTVSRIRQRSDLYRAGGVVMMLAAFLILAINLQQQKSFELFLEQIDALKVALAWGAVNGVLVSVLSIALMPIFEDLYGKTTDMRLLELCQKNELLQRLEQEAPGSYQHSMRVATLAESAAEAIHANALLVRVGTYYHDIGKIYNPQYFVENQQTSADKAKHSKITPNMSCLIIRNHVKHGIEMARQYKLPQEIVNFIPEHHGTTLMSYFYHQALANEENEGKIKEDDYRYPGPKPQSRETAILMLADALEATSRLLETPTERDVRQLVRKIINERFMDGQFDECDLTLRDLHTLFDSFSESILHTLHQRIAYPGPPSAKREEKDREARLDDESRSDEKVEFRGDEKDAAPVVALKEKRPASNGGEKKPAPEPKADSGKEEK
ncbi:MAG: HDIG domain-containing protein [bacterium]|nr:HDIG domain-containing protein [bacterium]